MREAHRGHCTAVLEHDPEKWKPVFGKRSCSNKDLERDDDSKKNHPGLGCLCRARRCAREDVRWMMHLFPTTIAGSLPKPAWLAEPNRLWPPWRLAGHALEEG